MPGGVAAVVVIVSTEDFAFASVMLTDGGLNNPLASADRPLTPNVTLPVNPPVGVTVTVKVVPLPGLTT